ncbi:preprotein translocase subunit YajC [Peptacetobacter sp.]|uniref:preprotein translocase subunit YajC n=1 Tax=unclassified Peptacetobacter TaxID=2991974 RepID=UPI002E7A7825|nr:preprotein translocase subunit YajC [Peptacetobacter sp.]MEE0452010.1 preprotein translocase subunit YajC [Peptacetobacter sp.]
MNNPTTIVLVYALGIFVLMYLFIVVPGKKKNKKMRMMHDSIKVGDEIITIGGIIGVVLERNDDEILLKIDEHANMRILVYAVQSIRKES